MFTSAIKGGGSTAPRLLSKRALVAYLTRWRLPSYRALSIIAERPLAARLLLSICQAYKDVFDLPEIFESICELEDFVLCKIDDHLFPLDHDLVCEIGMVSEDFICEWYVPAMGFGTAWELSHLCNLCDSAIEPLVSWIYSYLPTFYGLSGTGMGAEDHLMLLEDKIAEFRMTHGLCDPEGDEWGDRDYVLQQLNALPAPLNGLAAEYKLLRRDNGNMFLDRLSHGDYVLYGSCDSEFEYRIVDCTFEVDDLRLLTRMWELARPTVEKAEVYRKWFNDTPDALGRVVTALNELSGR